MHLWCYDNLIDDDVDFTLITGTQQSQYPLSNIIKNQTTKVSRVDVDSGEVEFYVDLTTTRTADTIILVGNSVDGLGFTSCSIYGSSSTDFSSSSEISLDVSSDYNIAFKEFTSSSYRYWKIKATAGSYVEISNIFLGSKMELDNNYIAQDSFSFQYQTLGNKRVNRYGQVFTNEYNRLQTLTGSINYLTTAEKTKLEEMAIEIGTMKPVYLIVDPNGTLETDSEFKYSGMYYFNEDFVFQAIGANLFNTSFSLTQAG